MPNVIFARPRWSYESYKDLYALIALSGYPLIYFDEIDPASDNAYVMTIRNGENENGWQGEVKARIILYDLEWRLEGDPPPIPGVAETWAADKWYAEQIGGRYVPLGSHPDLNPTPADEADKLFDVILLSYMTNRRIQMAVWLRDRGLTIADNGWYEVRHANLLSTRAMLHVHQHDHVRTVAPQRFALAAAYRMPLIAEAVCDPGIFADHSVAWSEYGVLADSVQAQLANRALGEYGDALYNLLCVEHSFRRNVEAAL